MFSFKNQEMDRYFQSLPAYVQENIVQSGAEIASIEDLRKVADHLCKK